MLLPAYSKLYEQLPETVQVRSEVPRRRRVHGDKMHAVTRAVRSPPVGTLYEDVVSADYERIVRVTRKPVKVTPQKS